MVPFVPQAFPQVMNRFDGRYGVVLVTSRGNVRDISLRSGVINAPVVDLGCQTAPRRLRSADKRLLLPVGVQPSDTAKASCEADDAREAQKRIIVPEWVDSRS